MSLFKFPRRLAVEIATAVRRFRYERTDDGRIFVPSSKLFIGGAFTHRYATAGGDFGPLSIDPNIVVDQGINYLLNAAFLGQAQETAFYVALFANNYDPVPTLTGANFNAQADEFTAYVSGTRPAWAIGDDPTTTKSVSNVGSEASFVYSAGGPYNIYGAAILTGSAKEGGADKLIAATRFVTPRTNQIAGDMLAVGYTLAGQDAG
jgi:hypothetical protein